MSRLHCSSKSIHLFLCAIISLLWKSTCVDNVRPSLADKRLWQWGCSAKLNRSTLNTKLSLKEPITSVVIWDPSSCRLIITTNQDPSRSGLVESRRVERRMKGGLRNDTRKDGRKAVDKGRAHTVTVRRWSEEEGIYRGNHFLSSGLSANLEGEIDV